MIRPKTEMAVNATAKSAQMQKYMNIITSNEFSDPGSSRGSSR